MSEHSVLVDLFTRAYLIRKAELCIQSLYHENQMRTPMHMSMGAEAIASGICSCLHDNDLVLGTYRSHALYLAKTMDTDGFFAEMYGKALSQAKGVAGSMHLSLPNKGHMGSSAIVATNIPVAVGLAYAQKSNDHSNRVITFFGDGATEEGVFWESLNLACCMSIPVIFVCEDNHLAVHTHPGPRRGFNKIIDIVKQYNCLTFETESTNASDIHNLFTEVLEISKKLSKPAFVLCEYFRYLEHVGINEDFESGYREKDAVWLQRDPIKVLESMLTKEIVDEIKSKVDEQVEKSILKAKTGDIWEAPANGVYFFA